MEKKKGRKVMEDKEEVVHKGIVASFLCIAMFALFVRVAISLHSYSSVGNPSKYGNFEA
jgi:alpha-1,3-glucosyltransferase